MKNYYYKLLLTAILTLGLNSFFAQVINQNCENALPISEGIFYVEDLSGGNGAIDQCFISGSPTHAVWYEYTPTVTGSVVISSEIDPELTDTRLSVFDGSCDELTCVAFDDDSGEGFSSLVYHYVEAGESIYIQWDDRWSSSPFSFIVSLEGEGDAGCTDPNAINYNPEAEFDDGSCIYGSECDLNSVLLEFEGGSFIFEIQWSVTDENGEIYAAGAYNGIDGYPIHDLCLPDGCFSFNMYDNYGDGWNGASAFLTLGDVNLGEGTLDDGTIGNFTFGVNVDECEDIVLEILGCTDAEALNYNVSATIDDGSCVYPFSCDEGVAAQLYVCVFGSGEQVGFELSGSDGSVVFDQDGFNDMEVLTMDICLEEGICYTATMTNNVGPFGWYGGYYWVNIDGATICTGALQDGEQESSLIFSIDGTCGEVFGCTDPEAENYDPNATVDNGSCVYFIANDDCENAEQLSEGTITINNQGATSNGLYGDCWGFGSGEPEQNGIWYSFTTPDEPALIIIEALADGSFTFTDTQFGLFLECGGEMIDCDGNSGEGLYSRFEFPCGYLDASTTYWLLIDGWAGDQGTCLLEYQIIEECESIEGCTDPEALNYNPDATEDNGSCIYEFDCDENHITIELEMGSFPGEVYWYITDQFGDAIYAEGGAFETELINICLPDGCYQLHMTDSWGDGWNGNILYFYNETELVLEATLFDGEYGIANFGINADCEFEDVYGCTDPEAWNYNPAATIDDGSCEYEWLVYGCTDPSAINYAPDATIDDGSCVYESDCIYNEGQLFLYNDEDSFVYWEIVNESGEYFYGSAINEGTEIFMDICLPDGCYNICFYGDFAPISGFVEFYVGDEGHFYEYSDQGCYPFSVNEDCDGEEVYGCTDPEALNYNSSATLDDGSCIYIPDGDCQASFEILSIDEDEDVMYILNTSTFGWGIEYLWDFGDGTTSTAPLPIHTYEEDGEYTICLTITGPEDCEDTFCLDIFYESPGFSDSDGFGANNGGFTINVVNNDVTDIESFDSMVSSISLYPNPTINVVNVDFVLNLNSDIVISVLDITGAQLMKQNLSQAAGFIHQTIDTESLSSGMYLLRLEVNGVQQHKRFSVIK